MKYVNGIPMFSSAEGYNPPNEEIGTALDVAENLACIVNIMLNTGYKDISEVFNIINNDNFNVIYTYDVCTDDKGNLIRDKGTGLLKIKNQKKMPISKIKEALCFNNSSALASDSKPVLSDSTMQQLRDFYYPRTPLAKNPTTEEAEKYFRDLVSKGEISEYSPSANLSYVIRDIMDAYIKMENELARFKTIPGFVNPVENNMLLRQQLNTKDNEIAQLKAELAKLNQNAANASLQTSKQVTDLQTKLDEANQKLTEVSKNNSDAIMYIESEKDRAEMDIVEGFLKGIFTVKC